MSSDQYEMQDDIRQLLREAEAIRNNPVSYFFFCEDRKPLLNNVLLPDNLN